jgi:putative ABC transport system permease protein
MSVQAGSFISEQNNEISSKVAVIGATVMTDLFGEDAIASDIVGDTIKINKIQFKIIGVLTAKGGTSFSSTDEMIFVPLSVMQKNLSGQNYLSSISVSVADKEQMELVSTEITNALLIKHNVATADFSIQNQADLLSSLSSVTATLTLFLASIAGISLVVGGIGIMNMMLTAVTERTREIGLKKSIGARKKDISNQFLAESIVLTFLGGLIGIILGWIIAVLISKFAGVSTQVSIQSIIMAFGVSALIGIIFGYYPSRRAASLNPIEALRYE